MFKYQSMELTQVTPPGATWLLLSTHLHGGVVSLLHKIYREKMTQSTSFYVFYELILFNKYLKSEFSSVVFGRSAVDFASSAFAKCWG